MSNLFIEFQKLIKHRRPDEWNEELLNSNGICIICNKKVGINNLELDHIIPLSKAHIGQIYNIKDVQPLCKRCNVIKGNRR